MSMALALPATTFATDSAATKAAPAEMRTRREDNIDRAESTRAVGACATGRSLSALHGNGRAGERAHGRALRRGGRHRRLEEVRELVLVLVLGVEDRRQRG